MKNYKLKIQYDGTNYSGWQIQPNAKTIQGEIEKALETILKVKTGIIGSGRTDAGVHAWEQIANFKGCIDYDLEKFRYSLDSILPDDISVLSVCEVPLDFNSRFDAIERRYIYFFSKIKSPFYLRYSSLIKRNMNLDIKRLNQISEVLLGKHDFTSLSKKNEELKNKECEVRFIRWKETKELVIFTISANRFLHGMVRTILGTLLEAAKRDYDKNYLLDIIEKKNRIYAAKSVEAKGLFLRRVIYHGKFNS